MIGVLLTDGKRKGVRVRCNTCYIKRLIPGKGLKFEPWEIHEIEALDLESAERVWDGAQHNNLLGPTFEHLPWGFDFDCE